ncbi:MAG: acyltransferase family protein [Oscillospiraceae bacterium]
MKRMEEIDFARVVAMVSVILIHVTSGYIEVESNFEILDMNIAFILNQVTRFAVPLFILLSGISIGLSDTSDTLRSFYRKRILKIGTPYIFWFLIYFAYNYHTNLSAITVSTFVRSFLFGQAAPHLYFIIILFQFYLLFPLLKRAVAKAPGTSVLISFLLSYAIQKLFYFLQFDMDFIPSFIRPYLWILFPTWLFYFVLGLALTKENLFHIQKFSVENSTALFLVTAVFAIFYVMDSKASGMLDAIKSSLNLFTILVFLCSFACWKYIGKYRVMQKATGFLAKHSMTIYFEHVLVLYYLLERFAVFSRGMSGMLLLFFADFFIATLLAVLIDGFTQIVKKALLRNL